MKSVMFLGPGLIMVPEGEGFRAAGCGTIVELEDARAAFLIFRGAASADLRERPELDPVGVEELKLGTGIYNTVHAVVLKDLEDAQIAFAARKAGAR